MSAPGNQTMVNDTQSIYLKAGSDPNGVPSPFSVVDEAGGVQGSRVTITDDENTATITNKDASGNTLSEMTMDPSGNISFATTPPPMEGYNLNITPSNARFTKPLIIQSGANGGLQMSNNVGLGTGVIKNSVTAPGNTPASIAFDQLGNVVVGGAGDGTANSGGLKVFTYNGGANTLSQLANPGSQQCVQTLPNDIRFLDSVSVTRGGIGLAGTTQVNVKGRNVAIITNSDQTPVLAATFDASGNFNTAQRINASGGFVVNSNSSVFGGLGVSGSLSVNQGINMDMGTTLNGPGLINLVNSGGFASGTITGLSNIPTAGVQPLTITGYNPGNPTPSVVITAGGTIGTANSTGWSTIGGVDLGRNYNGVTAPGGLGNFSFKNIYFLDATSSSTALVSLGDPATASILIATNYFVFGNNAGNVFDFHNVTPGAFMFLLLTGENNHGGGIVYWSGTAITWNSYGAGGGAQGPSGGSYTTSVNPLSGLASRWDYTYTGHAASGYGGIIMFRIV